MRGRVSSSIVILLVTAATATAAPLVTITGHGNGHGVGMSQNGAEGMARAGATYQRILRHYYPHTRLEVLDPVTIRVQLLNARAVPIDGGTGATAAFDGGDPVPIAGAVVARPLAGGRIIVRTADGSEVGRGTVVRITAPEPIALGDSRYRGALVLRRAGGQLRVIDDVPLDDYVRGVIAWEMPSSWQAAALAAQAVAARSYARAERRDDRDFDVYPDTRSQMYGGVRAETAATDAAVRTTAGVVVTYHGTVATTFFSDSSGGRTAAVEDVWGGEPVPYLVSVADPTDAISRYSTWEPTSTGALALGRRLGIGRVLGFTVERGRSRRVLRVAFTTRSGVTTFTGGELRSRLELRSTWFTLRLLDLRSVLVRHGRLEALGVAFPPGRVHLDGLIDGAWVRIATRVARGGVVRFRVRAHAATSYRLRTGPALSNVLSAPR